MDVDKIRQMGLDTIQQAVDLDNAHKYPEALAMYKKGMQIIYQYLPFEKNIYIHNTMKSKIDEYMSRSEEIKKYLEKKKEPEPVASGEDGKSGKKKDSENDKLKDSLANAIVSEKPNVRWDQVAGLETAKSELQATIIMPVKFPELFQGKTKPWSGILLYGPPGTGKSYLAKAAATESDSTFFSVSSSDLVSKWQGESAKLVKTLFEMAREKAPSIIFIDEVDALTGSRDDNNNSAGAKQVLTEMLVQMDGVGKGKDNVLVLAATNCPWDIDSAMRRRLQKRIYIPLPETDDRKEMFKIHLDPTKHCLTDEDLNMLAEKTEGYSGSDISSLCKQFNMIPITRSQSSRYFFIGEDGFYYACNEGDRGAINMGVYDIPNGKLRVGPVTRDDAFTAIKRLPKSVSPAELKRFEDWTKEFGENGSQ